MKSTAENPFGLIESYKNITDELYFNNVEEIDKKTHKVKWLNVHHSLWDAAHF
jgi:hypothetical protein